MHGLETSKKEKSKPTKHLLEKCLSIFDVGYKIATLVNL